MSLQAFEELARLLKPEVDPDLRMALVASEGESPLDSEIICACGIRYASGAEYGSISDLMGISDPSFY